LTPLYYLARSRERRSDLGDLLELHPTTRKGEKMTVRDMLEAHSRSTVLDRDLLLRCIEECIDCAATCTSCADADLAEPDVAELVRCVRLCLDCADACEATGRILIRQTEPDLGVLRAEIEACAATCRACAEECEKHASHHEHCRICAEVCRRCEQACEDLLATIRD
jgi:hypothetical protein